MTSKWSLAMCSFSQKKVIGGCFDGATFQSGKEGLDFSKSDFTGCSFNRAIFQGGGHYYASQCTFSAANMAGCSFKGAKFVAHKLDFSEASLAGASFEEVE